MNIAHIIPHSITLPLGAHNGRYDWVVQLAKLQVTAGHTVTIYSNPASHVDGVATRGIQAAEGDKKANNIATFKLAFAHGEHDIFHSHFDNLHYEVADLTERPIVFTQHWPPTEDTIRLAQTRPVNVWAVPPTRAMHQQDVEVGIQTKGFIYHGIDLEKFTAAPRSKNNRLLFVGRIAPEKNLEIALDVAAQSGIGLDIVGKVADKNQSYWQSLAARIDGTHVVYHGPQPQSALREWYANAQALIFPSETSEAFGLTAIEAQAAGTPVIMQRGGSRGELIIEGKTGYLCSSIEEFVQAVQQSALLSPDDCKQNAQQFDIHTMARAYDALYQTLLH